MNIERVRTLGSYKVTYQWNIVFNTFPTGINIAGGADAINFRCFSAQLPTSTIGAIPVSIRQHTIYQQGSLEYNPIELTFNDTTDEILSNFLRDWRELIFQSKTGRQAAKLAVEAQVDLQLLGREEGEVTKVYHLFGAWPESNTLPELTSRENEEVFRPTITLRYDYFLEDDIDPGNED